MDPSVVIRQSVAALIGNLQLEAIESKVHQQMLEQQLAEVQVQLAKAAVKPEGETQ